MKNNKVVTFGCRLNIFESEIIKKSLTDSGSDNTIVFNTCAVTKEAERQAMQAIRKAHRENPEKKIIVTGCAAQISPKKYAEIIGVTKVIGNEEKFSKDSYNHNLESKIMVNDIMSIKETAAHLVTNFENRSRAFVQVQNGCNHRCTFCTIPYGRGNSRSVAIGEIVKHVKILVSHGYKEIVFTGVDITDYGKDLPGMPTLGEMMRRVLRLVPELERLRLSSIDVAEIDKDLRILIEKEKRLMPHFHISLQAGDDMILKRMKRRHLRDQVLSFSDFVRELNPDATLGADIIAGFPTENDQMFENTKSLISEAGLQFLHVFPYSERENTPAAKMPKVPVEIRKKRAKILRLEGEKELHKFSISQIGKIRSSIIEKDGFAKTDNFLKVKIKNPEKIKNSVENIKLEEFNDNLLSGVIV